MIKARIRWCSCSVENILTLVNCYVCGSVSSSILFCVLYLKPLSYIQNNFSYELTSPIMGTIFLVLYISREISIEHPSVGLASLAQLYIVHAIRANFVLITRKEGRSVILKLLPELFVYVYVALRPRFTAAVKNPASQATFQF